MTTPSFIKANYGQIWVKFRPNGPNQIFTRQTIFSFKNQYPEEEILKNGTPKNVPGPNWDQIRQKLDQNWQKTLLCLNACLKLASHQNCILKVNSGQKMFQFYHIPRKSYQLDIFKGFLLVTVGPLCISYCHMKTAPPMNTYDFDCIKSVHRWRCFHMTIWHIKRKM